MVEAIKKGAYAFALTLSHSLLYIIFCPTLLVLQCSSLWCIFHHVLGGILKEKCSWTSQKYFYLESKYVFFNWKLRITKSFTITTKKVYHILVLIHSYKAKSILKTGIRVSDFFRSFIGTYWLLNM